MATFPLLCKPMPKIAHLSAKPSWKAAPASKSATARTIPTPAAMGHLTFTDLKIKKIDSRVAIVTGAFHLQRASAGGGDKSGFFSLVLERQGGGLADRSRPYQLAPSHRKKAWTCNLTYSWIA